MELSTLVLDYVSRARRSPAAAVDDALLDELAARAGERLETQQSASFPRDSSITWMVRAQLLSAGPELSAVIRVPLGESGTIVGFIPTLLSLGDPVAAADVPLEAVDIDVSLRHGKNRLTQRFADNIDGTIGETPNFVSLCLLSLDQAEGNRLIEWPVSAEADPNITFQFRWAVPAAARAAWDDIGGGPRPLSDVQISLGIIWLPE